MVVGRTGKDFNFIGGNLCASLAIARELPVATQTPKLEQGNLENARTSDGLGIRRRGKFAPADCRRGAHAMPGPAAMGARKMLSISWPTSAFGFNWLLSVHYSISKAKQAFFIFCESES
jgi:hypothetical protein